MIWEKWAPPALTILTVWQGCGYTVFRYAWRTETLSQDNYTMCCCFERPRMERSTIEWVRGRSTLSPHRKDTSGLMTQPKRESPSEIIHVCEFLARKTSRDGGHLSSSQLWIRNILIPFISLITHAPRRTTWYLSKHISTPTTISHIHKTIISVRPRKRNYAYKPSVRKSRL
jgi:hypothetical protein